MAASLRRGLVGEQKSREIGMVSTGGVVVFDKAAPQGVGSRLEVGLDGRLDGFSVASTPQWTSAIDLGRMGRCLLSSRLPTSSTPVGEP